MPRFLSCARATLRHRIYPAGLAIALGSSTIVAQTPDDSLAARLRRAEAAIEVLQQQLSEQAESGVTSRSRASIEITGRVMMNGFSNSRRVNNVDNPQFVRPDTGAPGFPARGVGMAMRQTTLGVVVRVPEVLGGSFTGDLDVDFAGGQFPSAGGRTFPLVRMRTARAVVRWSNAEVLVGQESPLVSGLNPVTPAAMSTPLFATSGNLWLWLPQVRAGVRSEGRFRLGVQAAVLAPTSGDPAGSFETDNDLAERSQRPFLQARASVAWGEEELAGEAGCGVHRGWLVPNTALVTSQAVACDALLPVTSWFEVRGEFFAGDALRGLGGGGIGQNFDAASEPLGTTGGWAQVNFVPRFGWRLGAGCGTDQPGPSAPTRLRNNSCATYAQWRTGPLILGLEARRLRTDYAAGRFTGDHVTLALGYEF